jgi:hypothetical protein
LAGFVLFPKGNWPSGLIAKNESPRVYCPDLCGVSRVTIQSKGNRMTITNCPMCSWEIPELSEPVKTCLECGADLSRWTARTKQPLPIPAKAESSDEGYYFARQAANFSLAAPFMAMAVSGCSREAVRSGNRVSMMIVGGMGILLIVSGFIFGVIALYRTKKCGAEGIFGKAIAGVCINGFFIVTMLISFHVLTKYYVEWENDVQRQKQIQRTW